MIILEGADGTGKTTAAETLATMMADFTGLPDRYRHMSKPVEPFDHFNGYIEQMGPVVQDRFHLGALVYGELLGNKGCPTVQQMLWLNRYLSWSGCLVIILHCPRQRLKELLSESQKAEMYKIETILGANDLYRSIARNPLRGEPYCQVDYCIDAHGWPSESTLVSWFERWRASWC